MPKSTDTPDVKLAPGRLAAVKLLAANHPKRIAVSNVTSADPEKPTVAAVVATWLISQGLVDEHTPKSGPRTIRLGVRGEHLAEAEGFVLAGQVGQPKAPKAAKAETLHRGTPTGPRAAKAAATKAAKASHTPRPREREAALVLDFEPTSGLLPMGGLRPLVLEALRCAAGPVGPVAIGKALGRSSGAVTNVLTKLVEEGLVSSTGSRPVRFSLVPQPAAPAADVATEAEPKAS